MTLAMRVDNTAAGLSILAACTTDVKQWYMQNGLQLNPCREVRSALHGHSHTAEGVINFEVSVRRGCRLAGGRFDASFRRHSRSSPNFR